MRPWEIRQLDRDTVFALYIRPRKRKPAPRPAPTYRQVWFAHGRRVGKSWLEIEADWQREHGA